MQYKNPKHWDSYFTLICESVISVKFGALHVYHARANHAMQVSEEQAVTPTGPMIFRGV